MINNIAHLSKVLHELATTIAERVGETSGYNVRKAQKWSASVFFRTLVGSFLSNSQVSLLNFCFAASLDGTIASRNGLNKRFTQRSANFMRAMLEETIKFSVGLSMPTGVSVLDRFDQVVISDSTIISLPSELATTFKGTSKEPDHAGYAALKAHVGLDLITGKMWGPFIGSGATHDNAGAIDFKVLNPGALLIRDLGFWDLSEWKQRQDRAIYTLSRLKASTVIYDRQGQPLDLLKMLSNSTSTRVELQVLIGEKERLPVRLLCAKVPELIKLARLSKNNACAEELEADWFGWTFLVTDVPAPKLSLPEAFALYRIRWEIELTFKRWKEMAEVDEWRTKNSYRILCEIYAKLICVVITHWLGVLSAWEDAERSMTCAFAMVRLMGLGLWLFLTDQKMLHRGLERLADGIFSVARLGKSKRKPSTAAKLRNPELALQEPDPHSDLPTSSQLSIQHSLG